MKEEIEERSEVVQEREIQVRGALQLQAVQAAKLIQIIFFLTRSSLLLPVPNILERHNNRKTAELEKDMVPNLFVLTVGC